MRFIPPAPIPAEAQLTALLEFLSDKEKYEKSFKSIKKLKDDVAKDIKENNKKLDEIEKWEKSYESMEEKLVVREEAVKSLRAEVDVDKRALDSDRRAFEEEKEASNREIAELKREAESDRETAALEKQTTQKEAAELQEEIDRIAIEREDLNKDIEAFQARQERIRLAVAG